MSLDILSNNKYDILNPMVENIHNKCIKMDKEERLLLVRRFQTVIKKFINKMTEVDKFFEEIYNRIGYTGSYFDGLRVGEATEFDLNLILKPKLKIKGEKHGCPAGFISVVVEEKYEKLPKVYKQWARDIGKNQVLLDPERVSSWLQGVVQRTITRIHEEKGYLFEDCSIDIPYKSGPAWTLVIVSHEHPMKAIDIDLVPVLEFPSYQWPITQRSRFMWGSFAETWFAVPKPPRGYCQAAWRLSFPYQERAVLNDYGYLKYTLRLLKRARDQFELYAIASYYIKTIFLWETKSLDRSCWTRNSGRLFIHMLNRLKDALGKGKIPFFWDEKCNLIEHVNYSTLANFHGRLNNFLKIVNNLIDTRNYKDLEIYINSELSTPQEVLEEETRGESYCTIL